MLISVRIFLIVLSVTMPYFARGQIGRVVMTLCNEEEEISRKEMGNKCLVKYRRRCGCRQEGTESKPKDEPCDCSNTVCEVDFVDYKVEDKRIPGEPPVKPPQEDHPEFSTKKFYCKEETARYNISVYRRGVLECLEYYTKRCSCILDGEGNIVPNPDADPPCEECLTEFCRVNEKGKCIDQKGLRKVGCDRQPEPPVEEPPVEDPPEFSRDKLYCEEEELFFKLFKVDDVDNGYQCIGKFTKRCACIVDENGNIVPNPDVNPPCKNCLAQFCQLDADGNCIDETSERRVPLDVCLEKCGGGDDRRKRKASACSYERSCVFDGSCCDDYFDVCVSPSAGPDGFPTCYTLDEGCCTNGGCCDGVVCT